MPETSRQQIEANRRNCQLSTGPRTEQGKARSSRNAVRHGITGQINVLTPTEREVFDRFCEDFVRSLKPQSEIELHLAQAAAEDAWRLSRARAIENNIFALAFAEINEAAESAAETPPDLTTATSIYDQDAPAEDISVDAGMAPARLFVSNPQRFHLLTLYEQRIHRSMQRSLRYLQEFKARAVELEAAQREIDTQKGHKRNYALEEAALLLQMNEMKGIPWDAEKDFADPNGFVFSNDEIQSTLTRRRHLREARYLENLSWNPSGRIARDEPEPITRAA